jgi:hypothetical protein
MSFRLGFHGLLAFHKFRGIILIFIHFRFRLLPLFSESVFRICNLLAQKLSAQSKNDLAQMEVIKEVRKRYIIAHDQLFFPLNIEVQKAETRYGTLRCNSMHNVFVPPNNHHPLFTRLTL